MPRGPLFVLSLVVHRAFQYAGFTVMPILGGYFSYLLHSREIPLMGRFLVLSEFTAPSFLLIAAGTILLVLLRTVFEDGKWHVPHFYRRAPYDSARH